MMAIMAVLNSDATRWHNTDDFKAVEPSSDEVLGGGDLFSSMSWGASLGLIDVCLSLLMAGDGQRRSDTSVTIWLVLISSEVAWGPWFGRRSLPVDVEKEEDERRFSRCFLLSHLLLRLSMAEMLVVVER